MKTTDQIVRQDSLNRRVFLQRAQTGIGAVALATLLGQRAGASEAVKAHTALLGFPNFAPKAKRIIYLFQSGAPSQMDLFDPSQRWRRDMARTCPTPSARGSA